jgi:hypothetical protein
MVAIPQAMHQHACSMSAAKHAAQHAVQQGAFVHTLQAHIAAITQQMYALQMQNEQLRHENSYLKYLVGEHKLDISELSSDLGSQDQLSQASSSEDEMESEPEIIEVIDDDDDDSEKVDLPPALPACEAITTCASSVAGKASVKVQWRVHLFSERMNRGRGRPLVSPAFCAGDLAGLRLSVAPDQQNSKVLKNERSLAAFKKLVTTGPFSGRLTLKTENSPQAEIEYYVSINNHTAGPFLNDFSEQCSATHDDLGINWLQDKNEDGSLLVGVEIVLPQSKK